MLTAVEVRRIKRRLYYHRTKPDRKKNQADYYCRYQLILLMYRQLLYLSK